MYLIIFPGKGKTKQVVIIGYYYKDRERQDTMEVKNYTMELKNYFKSSMILGSWIFARCQSLF